MRQIAYVGEDGETSVYDLDLDREIPISGAAAISSPATPPLTNWPTWSPTGDRLAYFRYELEGTELRTSGVTVADADGSNLKSIYDAAHEAPICMCWSPDGMRIALLVQAQDELYLRVVDPRGSRPPLTVAQGAPLYFTWQPDSRGLVVHVGLGRRSMPLTRITWVRLEGGQVTQTPVVRPAAPGFRAPCWSARLQGAVVALESGQRSELALVASGDADPAVLTPTGAAPVFGWNADGSVLAYASRSPDSGALYTGLWVYAVETGQTKQIVDTPVLAFFGHPDGQRVLYASGDIADRVVSVHLVDVTTGERVDVGWVRPSRDLFMLFSHFDQYGQAASLISSDGAELVLAASRAKERENGTVPTVRQILVRGLGEPYDERVITRGRLAFWRPA
jgi:Tol biopolymer transport system component